MKTIMNTFIALLILSFNIMTSCSSEEDIQQNDVKTETDEPSTPIEEEEKEKEENNLPELPADQKWVLQENLSNEFNYEGKDTDEFNDDWKVGYINPWTGLGKTRNSDSQSSITNGEMIYKATVVGETIKTGCISSKTTVQYPMYMVVRAKISESSLSTAVWMLSQDSTEEIDNMEAYGDKTNSYFSKRLHLSHHTFIRDPFDDYQSSGPETYYEDGKGTYWADDFHEYGVLWQDPWTLKYYVDGELVRTTPKNEIDPRNHTNGNGLTKPMYLIISVAAQSWRENQGINYLTDPSVLSESRSTARFDWIRVYKPE